LPENGGTPPEFVGLTFNPLCDLCELCVAVVDLPNKNIQHRDPEATEDAQRKTLLISRQILKRWQKSVAPASYNMTGMAAVDGINGVYSAYLVYPACYWLAKESGINYDTLARIEAAEHSNRIELRVLDGICRALECQPGDILVWVGDSKRKLRGR
jgi:DNA-binding Xre family transcriptional regulator